jgi:hypothetical protein
LPSSGNRFIPNDIPNRRLLMGPNIGDGKIIVAILLLFDGVIWFLFFQNNRHGVQVCYFLPKSAGISPHLSVSHLMSLVE